MPKPGVTCCDQLTKKGPQFHATTNILIFYIEVSFLQINYKSFKREEERRRKRRGRGGEGKGGKGRGREKEEGRGGEEEFFVGDRGGEGFPGRAVVKNPPANAGRDKRHWFDPWVRKFPWRKK